MSAVSLDQRVQASRARSRRRWALRTLLLLTVSSAVLFGFVVWHRDQGTIQANLEGLQKTVRPLQEKIDQLGYLPAVPPHAEHLAYASDIEREYALSASEPAIIAFAPAVGAVRLFLREDGRCVILYEDGKVRLEWYGLSKFRRARQQQRAAIEAFEEARSARPPELP